jgi:single-strand DNA-binding protein
MIKAQIIGSLGKDATVNEVNGKTVINFSVAHSERYKDAQGNQQEKTTWAECAYWVKTPTLAQYLTKGKKVFVEGQPEARAFTRNDGTAGASLVIRVRELQLLSSNEQQQGSSNAHVEPYVAQEAIDELPF